MPQVLTEIPWPVEPAASLTTLTREEIIELDQSYVVPTYKRAYDASIPVLIRGRGLEVWDADGRRYLDFGGGIAVNVLGHAHPSIREALATQAGTLIHTSNLFFSAPQAILAERLIRHFPGGKIFFCNSGAEANEALYKLARKVGNTAGRHDIITALNSFHGRTLAGISATGQEKVRLGFAPVTPGFVHVPYNDLAAVESAITDKTTAVLIEGIQGEGGVFPASPDYLLGLRKLCDQRGLLLMMDAVQCGYFRTGRFQSYQRLLEGTPNSEHFAPDALSMAKSLGGGFPIGAVWISPKYQDVFQPGSHGTTYGGTPLGCAVALAVLQTIERENLMDNARQQGEFLHKGLEAISRRHPGKIKAVRGYGCLLGLECVEDSLKINQRLQGMGLILIPAANNTLRLLPPLNVLRAECQEALELIEQALVAGGE